MSRAIATTAEGRDLAVVAISPTPTCAAHCALPASRSLAAVLVLSATGRDSRLRHRRPS